MKRCSKCHQHAVPQNVDVCATCAEMWTWASRIFVGVVIGLAIIALLPK